MVKAAYLPIVWVWGPCNLLYLPIIMCRYSGPFWMSRLSLKVFLFPRLAGLYYYVIVLINYCSLWLPVLQKLCELYRQVFIEMFTYVVAIIIVDTYSTKTNFWLYSIDIYHTNGLL